MRKRFLGLLYGTIIVSFVLSGCGNKNETEQAGKVYFLNFKPEVQNQWKEIAEVYKKETGVEVKVQTAASGTYEEVLKSEIAKSDAVTMFQINGPIGYNNWKDYCMDLSDTKAYQSLTDKGMAVVGDNGGVYGIPYAIETYGIIYNNAIMDKYFALEGAVRSSMDEIDSFEDLKAVAEDMQEHKEELGIKGVFASTSLASGEDWRWQTHLANIPIFYELQDKKVTDTKDLQFTYAGNMKNIFDLYMNCSVTAPGLLGDKSVSDSMAEFALGQAAMVQNGNWAWGQISDVPGNTVKEENVKFLPIYMGIKGEENQGLCTGTENFWCINSQASEADRKASVDFMDWLVTSDTGKDFMVNKLGNSAPFTTFTEEEKPTDPLAKEMFRYMNSGKSNINWAFTVFPSQQFKNDFGAALLEYCSGNMTWDEVQALVISRWAEEKALTAAQE